MKVYDMTTYEDLLRYVALGLPPGSFGAALLLGDLEMAYRCAHPFLLPPERCADSHAEGTESFSTGTGQDIVLNMFLLVEERFPPLVRGSAVVIQKWIAHQGYRGASDETKALFLMFCAGTPLLNRVQILVRAC